jgi:uncharacterized LabA/DUF88 family protein
MGTKISLSEQRVVDAGLQKTQIAKMRDYAMDTPESREQILGTLKEYERKYQGTEEATAASRAITTIMTVSMLEALQSD